MGFGFQPRKARTHAGVSATTTANEATPSSASLTSLYAK